jgi:hypothetical protein
MPTNPTPERPLTRADWDTTAQRTIFFGHQSVGDNILEGVRQIGLKEQWPPLRIVDVQTLGPDGGPALAHAKIGRNGDPASKVKSFQEALDAGVGKRVDIALMKFCFWDIRHDTNLDAVFNQYRETMVDLERRYPRVTFVHATVPLMAADVDWRARVRRLLAMSTPTDRDNAARDALNRKIREHYGPRSLLLDIARSETEPGVVTNPPQLAADFSSDGAHLNDVGRSRVAAAFVKSLSNASTRGSDRQ